MKQNRSEIPHEKSEKIGLLSPEARHSEESSKFSKGKAVMFFIYNISGNSSFTLHMTLSGIGLFWAVVISAVITACVCYCLNAIEEVLSKLERENLELEPITSGNGLVKALGIPYVSIVNIVFVIATVCSVQSDALTDLTLVTTNMKHLEGVDPLITKLVLTLIVLVLVYVITNLRQIEGIISASFVIYAGLVVTFFGSNIYLLVSRGPDKESRPVGWFETNGIEDYISNLNQALTFLAYYFFSRNISKRDATPADVSYIGSVITALSYLAISFTSQAAFSLARASTHDSFRLYSGDIPVLKYSIYAYLPVAVTNMLFCAFVSAELLQSLSSGRISQAFSLTEQFAALRNMRVGVWLLSVAVTSLFANVLTVISAAGSLFTPLVGFIIPLVYFYTYHLSRKTGQLSSRRILTDSVICLVTVYFMFLGFRNAVNGKFEDI